MKYRRSTQKYFTKMTLFFTETLITRLLIVLYLLSYLLSTVSSQDVNSDLPICNKTQNSFLLNSSSTVVQNFTSPNYPQNYPLYSNCIWIITAPLSHLIKLTFSSFSIYTTSDSTVQQCPYAYIQVVEELTKGNSEIVGRFCGSQTPQTIYSSGGRLKVVFKNTLLTSAKGFVAQYSTVSKGLACSSQNTLDENSNILLQETTTGLIKPPIFDPDSYSGLVDCTWKISLPSNKGINMSLISFTAKKHAKCIDSSLEVYNARYGIGHGARIGLFCENAESQVIFSSGRYLSLRWRAKNPKMAVGFQMGFKAIRQTKTGSCDASGKEVYLNGVAGSIFTPGYPIDYPNSIDCTWIVTVPVGLYVRLKFKTIQLEPGSSCADNVVVKDGNRLLAKLCGSSKPQTIVSYSKQIQIKFSSNLASSGKGFFALFDATTQAPKVHTTPITQPGICSPLNTKEINNNLQLSGSSGFVASPMYPSQYPNSISCTWRISVSSSKRIHLVFEDFWIDDQHGCQGDYLEIRDGSQKSSPQIGGKNCGNKKPAEVYSTGSYLWLQFVSDSGGTSHGFMAKFSAVNKPFNRFNAVGVGIGALALVLVAILVYWKIKKKRNKGEEEPDEDQSGTLDRDIPENALLGNGTKSSYDMPLSMETVPMETVNNGDKVANRPNNEQSEEFAWFKPNKRKSKGMEVAV